MRRAEEGTIDYDLPITSSLPKRDAVLKSKTNKQRLASVLSTSSLGENAVMESRDDGGAFSHDKADITTMSISLRLHMVSDDTNEFVLLVY